MTTLGNPSDCSTAFYDVSQSFVVVQLANQQIFPKASQPAFRILGAFPSNEKALKHANRVNEKTMCTTIITKLHDFFAILNNYDHANVDYQKQHVAALLQRDKDAEEEAFERFEQRKKGQNAVAEESAKTTTMTETDGERKSEQKSEEKSGNVADIFNDLVIPNQQFAVVSFLEHEVEPCVKIYGLCPTITDSEKFSQHVVAHKVKDHDIVTVDMYQWIYPRLYFCTNHRNKMTYRNKIQNDIMQGEFSREAKINDFMATKQPFNTVEIKN